MVKLPRINNNSKSSSYYQPVITLAPGSCIQETWALYSAGGHTTPILPPIGANSLNFSRKSRHHTIKYLVASSNKGN